MNLWDALKAKLRFGAWGGQQNAGGSINDWVSWYTSYPGASYNYRAAVGRIQENGVVQCCISWMQRACTEPQLQVVRVGRDGEENEVPRHPLSTLLRRPNPFTTRRQLWQATLTDWMTTGNAFWLKVRNGSGEVIELHHLPESRIRPQWPPSGTVYISHYLHNVSGIPSRFPVEDIVHFKFGKHPDNERLGWSPVLAGLREIACLNEGANYRGALLRNRAVASHLVSSKDSALPLTSDQAKAFEALWVSKTSGDGSGRPLFSSIPLDVEKLGYSPKDLDLGKMLNWDADLTCALFGLNSMTVALTAGEDHKTYANYAEGREACFEQAVLPTLWDFAETLDLQLLGEFGDVETEKVSFDLSNVRILQEDQTALWKRLDDAIKTGWLLPNEARAMVNLPEMEGGDKPVMQDIAKPEPFGGPESQGDRAVTAPQPAARNGAIGEHLDLVRGVVGVVEGDFDLFPGPVSLDPDRFGELGIDHDLFFGRLDLLLGLLRLLLGLLLPDGYDDYADGGNQSRNRLDDLYEFGHGKAWQVRNARQGEPLRFSDADSENFVGRVLIKGQASCFGRLVWQVRGAVFAAPSPGASCLWVSASLVFRLGRDAEVTASLMLDPAGYQDVSEVLDGLRQAADLLVAVLL